VPGYQGYVPSVKSENLFGKSYARMTGASINKELNQGADLPPKERFKSMQQNEFAHTNFRRLVKDQEPAENRDKQDANNFTDAE